MGMGYELPGLNILLLAPLLPLGLWIGWRGLNFADWRDGRFSTALRSVGTMLAGAAIATAGVVGMIVQGSGN